MTKRLSLFVVLIVVSFLVANGPAFADTVNVGASCDGCDAYVFNFGATQFTLANPTQVDVVSLGAYAPLGSVGYETPPFTVSIVSALSGGTTYWTSGPALFDIPTFNPTSLVLDPGTYYLVESPSVICPSCAVDWLGSNGTLSQVGGSVGSAFYFSSNGSSWSYDSGFYPLQFDVQGTAVPEPSTLFFLGPGLLGLLFVRRSLRVKS
jgi:hypothetical protein